MDNLDNDDLFYKLKKQMGITYQDNVVICPDKMPNYQEKVNVENISKYAFTIKRSKRKENLRMGFKKKG